MPASARSPALMLVLPEFQAIISSLRRPRRSGLLQEGKDSGETKYAITGETWGSSFRTMKRDSIHNTFEWTKVLSGVYVKPMANC